MSFFPVGVGWGSVGGVCAVVQCYIPFSFMGYYSYLLCCTFLNQFSHYTSCCNFLLNFQVTTSFEVICSKETKNSFNDRNLLALSNFQCILVSAYLNVERLLMDPSLQKLAMVYLFTTKSYVNFLFCFIT